MKITIYKIKTSFDASETLHETVTPNIGMFNLSKDDLTKLSLKETVSIKTPLNETNFFNKTPNDKKYKKGDVVKLETGKPGKDITVYVREANDEHAFITFDFIKDSEYVFYEISYHEEIEIPQMDLSYMEKPSITQENYEDPSIKYIFDNKDKLI